MPYDSPLFEGGHADSRERIEPQSTGTESWLRWLIGAGVGTIVLLAILILQPSLLLTLSGMGVMGLAVVGLAWFPIFYVKYGLPESILAYVVLILAAIGWVFLCIQFTPWLLVLLLFDAFVTVLAVVVISAVEVLKEREQERERAQRTRRVRP